MSIPQQRPVIEISRPFSPIFYTYAKARSMAARFIPLKLGTFLENRAIGSEFIVDSDEMPTGPSFY